MAHLLASDVSGMLQSVSVEGATPTESPDEREAPGNPLLLTEAWCSVVYAEEPEAGAENWQLLCCRGVKRACRLLTGARCSRIVVQALAVCARRH